MSLEPFLMESLEAGPPDLLLVLLLRDVVVEVGLVAVGGVLVLVIVVTQPVVDPLVGVKLRQGLNRLFGEIEVLWYEGV